MTEDVEAITQTALDYIKGWYAGDADRMARSLHPDLAKRIQRRDADGDPTVDHMTAEELIGLTKQGLGRDDPAQRTEVTVHDVYGAAASVRVDAGRWIDFLHMIRTAEGWKIVNVLWELRPPEVLSTC